MQNSPFVILVEGLEPKKAPAVGSPCDVNLVLPDISLPRDLPYLKATLTRPTGKKEPLELGIGPDNSLSMNFTPNETGKHVIDITKNGKPIKQSPITILVEEEEKPKVIVLLDKLFIGTFEFVERFARICTTMMMEAVTPLSLLLPQGPKVLW